MELGEKKARHLTQLEAGLFPQDFAVELLRHKILLEALQNSVFTVIPVSAQNSQKKQRNNDLVRRYLSKITRAYNSLELTKTSFQKKKKY